MGQVVLLRDSDSFSTNRPADSLVFPRLANFETSQGAQDLFQMEHSHSHSHSHPHTNSHNSHNYAAAQNSSISPTDYYGGLELTSLPAAATTTAQPIPGPRSYKSRKYRPCDFCRARQVACKIDSSPPCSLCSSHSKQCTFVERPEKKRRPNAENGDTSGHGNSGESALGWRSPSVL